MASAAELLETIEDLVAQFAYHAENEDGPAYSTGGLSALEGAFAVLGWSDPHPCPERACEFPSCHKWATCGTPTTDSYKWCCSEHFEWYHEHAPFVRPTPPDPDTTDAEPSDGDN